MRNVAILFSLALVFAAPARAENHACPPRIIVPPVIASFDSEVVRIRDQIEALREADPQCRNEETQPIEVQEGTDSPDSGYGYEPKVVPDRVY